MARTSRRIRITLTILVASAMAAVVGRFVWTQMQIARTVARVEELGGGVNVSETVFGGPEEVTFCLPGVPSKLDDAALQGIMTDLASLPRLRSVIFSGANLTDAGIAGISCLPLTHLDLSNTRVSDKCINELSAMRQLTSLCLQKTAISDVGIKELAHRLRHTAINTTGISIFDWGRQELQAPPE